MWHDMDDSIYTPFARLWVTVQGLGPNLGGFGSSPDPEIRENSPFNGNSKRTPSPFTSNLDTKLKIKAY